MNKLICYEDIFAYNRKLQTFQLPKHQVWVTDEHNDVYRIVSIAPATPDNPTFILFQDENRIQKSWMPMHEFVSCMELAKVDSNLPLMVWLLACSNVCYQMTSDAEEGKATYNIVFDNNIISSDSMLDVIYELYLKVYDSKLPY
jgi:hypothetical protein